MQRYGMITSLHPGKVEEYIRLHTAVWPEILEQIKTCNIQNYSIYHQAMPDGTHLLFSYYEYNGSDYQADMDLMAADPRTQDWWALCNPCQKPIQEPALGGAWTEMQEVFRLP